MDKIYLDNNSTTQVDPNVLEKMLPYFNIKYGNASSQSHPFGWEAQAANDIAREQISQLINCNSEEIIFTSGATESNNLAINGFYKNNKFKGSNIITSSIEHKAVLDVCDKINSVDNPIVFIKPDNKGIVDIKKIKESINTKTILVSIMHANNEIGSIQPLKEIGKLCKKNNIIFHVDAAQSLGKIEVDVADMNIDLLSISGHKIYGPKGIGALYIKTSSPKINLEPIIVGGGQEKNYRSGTMPTPLIVGFGEACKICFSKMKEDNTCINEMSNTLINNILKAFPDTKLNGSKRKRIPGNINLSFPFLNGMSIIRSMPKIAVSSGSACNSSSTKPSHVLTQIGLSKLDANSTIRIGIGRFNKNSDITIASDSIINALNKKI